MRTVTALLCLAILLGCVAAAVAQKAPPGLDAFFVSTASPAGWQAATADQIPLRLRGTFLAGWQKNTANGPAAIYLMGVRRPDAFSIGDAGAAFIDYLTEKKVQFVQDSKFTVAGRDATKFSFSAPGNGQIVTALSSSAKDNVSTYMEIIIVANGWTDGKGTDLIHFVLAVPAASKDDLRGAFKDLITMTAIKGKYNPAPGQPAAEDGGDDPNLVATGIVMQGQPPVLKPGPAMPVGMPVTAPSPTAATLPVGTRFLQAVPAGDTAIWVAPQHDIGEWYVLVWPAKHEAYVLSGDEYKKMALLTQGLLVLPFSPALQPNLNRWDKLWPPAADTPAK